MSETLHDCPKCGRKNFTTSGLKAHRCKAKSAEISVEVVKPDEAKSTTVVLFATPGVLNLSEADMVRDIRHDHEFCERNTRLVALVALRNGLRLCWIKYNAPHGSLEKFLKSHFNKSRATMFNYIRMADEFCTEAKLRDKKTFKLTDPTKIAPILTTQLDLFRDDANPLDQYAAAAVKWIGDRNLSKIYRDLGREDESGPPQGHQGDAKKKKKTPEQVQREAFTSSLTDLKSDFATHKWHALFEKDRLDLEKWTAKAAITVREYNAGCAKAAKQKGAAAK